MRCFIAALCTLFMQSFPMGILHAQPATQLPSYPATKSTSTPSAVTRAEAAMVLLLSRVSRVADAKNNGRLKDIPEGSWYERYVVMAERYKILTPDSHMRIYPEAEITRVEFLKMIALTYGLKENLPHLYRDVPTLAWYAKYAGVAPQYNVFPRDFDRTKLYPLAKVTIEETAQAIRSVSHTWEEERASKQELAQPSGPNLQKPTLAISTKTEQITRIDTLGAYWAVRPVESFRPITEAEKEQLRLSIGSTRSELLQLTNEERRRHGLRELRYNPFLEETAQRFAGEMAKDGFFGHVSPGKKELRDRIEEAIARSPLTVCSTPPCARRLLLGENLARGQRTAAAAMTAWMRSPSHRDAILNPSFQEIGIGVNAGIWVEHFSGELKN